MMATNDEQILAALISAGSVRAAAQLAGVSEGTVRNRLADRDFRQKYDQMRGDLLQAASAGLLAKLDSATATLAALMNDSLTADSTRLNAADAILRHGLRYVSISEIERRIAALEAAAQEDET